MKASVIYLLIIGLASATAATEQGDQSQVEQVAQAPSWIGKVSITNAQFKRLKEVQKTQQMEYRVCTSHALKDQRWCSVQDVDMFNRSIQRCMYSLNRVLYKVELPPNVFLNPSLTTAAEVDVPEFQNALDTAHAESGNAKCLNGPKSLADFF